MRRIYESRYLRRWMSVLFVGAFAGVLHAAVPAAPKIGSVLEDFTLINALNNEATPLSDFAGKKAIVLLFIGTECPISAAYDARMEALHKTFASKGIQVVGINSNDGEMIPDVAKHAKAGKLIFPILKDTDNLIADVFGAQFTPEAYLLEVRKKGDETKFLLRYHGRIDDNRDPARVKEKPLENALTAFLAGKPIPKPTTKAFGSPIERVEKGKPGAATP